MVGRVNAHQWIAVTSAGSDAISGVECTCEDGFAGDITLLEESFQWTGAEVLCPALW